MAPRPDYGVDSPSLVAAELVLGALGLGVAGLLHRRRSPTPLTTAAFVAGSLCLLNALSMLRYSRQGKLHLREQALQLVHWRGDEQVLDVGCGRGLLLVGAARRLTSGRAVGVDRWVPGALSGNRPAAVLRNAALEGVAERVAVQEGDARQLPFGDATFDVVVSNFVLHEMDTHTDRERMLHEAVRVLKPGGQVVLVDFVFTGTATRLLRIADVRDAHRVRIGSAAEWYVALLLSCGLVRLYAVIGRKDGHGDMSPAT